jgi:hypothetical protein
MKAVKFTLKEWLRQQFDYAIFAIRAALQATIYTASQNLTFSRLAWQHSVNADVFAADRE